jgi:parallel beta-helix repeat protein
VHSIEGLNLTDCSGGFIIYNSTNCTIENNSITSKRKPGIFIDSSSLNIIANNTMRFNSKDIDQGIRLNKANYNIIENNSITTDANLFMIDVGSIGNTFVHNFKKFPGWIFNFEDRTNCSIDCSRHDSHKIRCPEDSENRRDCIRCIPCDEINKYNNWTCI